MNKSVYIVTFKRFYSNDVVVKVFSTELIALDYIEKLIKSINLNTKYYYTIVHNENNWHDQTNEYFDIDLDNISIDSELEESDLY